MAPGPERKCGFRKGNSEYDVRKNTLPLTLSRFDNSQNVEMTAIVSKAVVCIVNGNSRGRCSGGRKGKEVLDQKIAAHNFKTQNGRDRTK
jgi:hypothetical protein